MKYIVIFGAWMYRLRYKIGKKLGIKSYYLDRVVLLFSTRKWASTPLKNVKELKEEYEQRDIKE